MSDTAELRKIVTEFMLSSVERTARNETQIDNLTSLISELTLTVKENVQSNNEIKEQMTSLETKAINKLELVEDSVNELRDDVQLIDKRVTVHDNMLSTLTGREAGRSEVKETFYKRWGLIIAGLGLILTVSVTLITKYWG